jgi:hypothetical protein
MFCPGRVRKCRALAVRRTGGAGPGERARQGDGGIHGAIMEREM